MGQDAGTDTGTTIDANVRDTGLDAGSTNDSGVCSSASCDDGTFCNGAELCLPGSAGADANGCTHPGASSCAIGQTCNEALDRCETGCATNADADGDGVDSIDCPGGTDCDDADPNRYPGRAEVCDVAMHDEDCDPSTFGIRDADGDGEPDARCCNVDSAGTPFCGSDCDDTRVGIHPSAPEVCNGRDDDCDAATDEGVLVTYYSDVDGDNFGSSDPAAASMMACSQPAGFAVLATDCDDGVSTIHPGAVDTCDPAPDGGMPLDEDCDGTPNNPAGGCSCTLGSPARACDGAQGVCAAGTQDCLSGTWGSCSIAPVAESCNGLDDDCDGTVDDGVRQTCYADADNDGYAASATPPTDQCPVSGRPEVGGCPVNYTNRAPIAPSDDCDDGNGARNPAATEVCNMADDDCDSSVDETVGIRCYADVDLDGYATMGAPGALLCPSMPGVCPGGYTTRMPTSIATSDCNDAAGTIHPMALEACDTIDNDCNGVIDDGSLVACFGDGDDDGYAPTGATRTMVCPVAARTAVGGCPLNTTNRDPAVSGQADCMDANRDIHPGALELCDGIDNDCVGGDNAVRVTCYVDADNDTYSPMSSASSMQCPDGSRTTVGNCPTGYTDRTPTSANTSDCNDAAAGGAMQNPSLMEMCQVPAFDQNCNGNADEGYVTCYVDADGDGFAATGAASLAAACPIMGGYGGCGTNYTSRNPALGGNADCDPADATQNPLATEVCDARFEDDNCNGTVDEGFQVTRMYYRDGDGDTYTVGGLVGVMVSSCRPAGYAPSGYTQTSRPTDCCDSNSSAFPGATAWHNTPACGSFDFNCDGLSTPRPNGIGVACGCSGVCGLDAAPNYECYPAGTACGATGAFSCTCGSTTCTSCTSRVGSAMAGSSVYLQCR